MTKQIPYTELNVGDIVNFYGARFEIVKATCFKETEQKYIDNDCPVIMSAQGKWLDGNIINGYFGPTKDWIFQGNKLAIADIE